MPDVATPVSNSSVTNLVIITRRDRYKAFCKIYWRILVILLAPILLLPVALIGQNNAYKSFYVFLVTVTYWIIDAMHPGIAALCPIVFSSLMGSGSFLNEIYVRNEMLDCISIMLIMIGVEQSQLHKRIALKYLLACGCSHYRLSFILFFITMFMSMWVSGIIACGLMMPFVMSILTELEKLGILEVYQTFGKVQQEAIRHGERALRPSHFTIFYFLGIAFSSSIGSAGTLIGSQSNQIFKTYCETFFPIGPKIEFPHFMLLNLPAVLVMEAFLYFWMNFYFLGMCRMHTTDISLDIGMTEEEAQYINTILTTHYNQIGKITFHEWIIGAVIILTTLMQATMSSANVDHRTIGWFYNHFKVSSPSMMCAILLFIIPRDLSFLHYFKKTTGEPTEPLPTPIKTCLTWSLVNEHFHWSVLFIIAGSMALFDGLRDAQMTDEFEKFLMLCAGWPSYTFILFILIFFKCFTEFAPSSCIAHCMLPHVARLSVRCGINPHFLMMAATLSSSLSFHLVTGSPVNAMVAAYVHIPHWNIMTAGVGVSLASVCCTWFTVAVWAAAVWNDSYERPEWSTTNHIHLST